MTSHPLSLGIPQKDSLDDILEETKQFDWEVGEYLFHDFIDYFQLPQIVRVSQTWDSNLVKNDILYLNSMHDRHLIVAKSLLPDSRVFILPDWFQGQCRILNPNPKYKSRWWEFNDAMELLRFEMPRPHIRLLSDTYALLLLPTNQTIPVLLKENTEVTLKRIEKSTTITDGREMFVLVDKNDQEFLIDPTESERKFRFATKILDNEFDEAYHKNTVESLFSIPEIIIRYELPIDIEIVSSTNTIPVENFPTKLRLEKYSIAKSIIAFSIGDTNHPKICELSVLTQFSLNCIRCLTTGLPRDSSVYEEPRTFDETAYVHYETVRERLGQLFEDITLQYLRTPFVGSQEEVDCIEKVYDIGAELKSQEKHQTYTVLDQNCTTNTTTTITSGSDDVTPSIGRHPARFTVHLPADFNSPYSGAMEINDNNEVDFEIGS